MPTLTITRRSANRVAVLVTADDGAITANYAVDPLSASGQQRTAKAAGITLAVLLPLLQTATADGSASLTVTPPDAAPTCYSVLLRGRVAPATSGVTFTRPTAADALAAALDVTDYPAPEPVIEWGDDAHLCCLDVDYHTIDLHRRLSDVQFSNHLSDVRPTPFLSHLSHGRGAKLYYASRDGYTARELAAVAALSWIDLDGRATFELKRQSRSPHYPRLNPTSAPDPPPGPVVRRTPSGDVDYLRTWFGSEVDPAAVARWREDRGLQPHHRYSHAACPICPTPGDDKRDCVFIGDMGILCHYCAGRGYSRGRKAGFVPWATLVGRADSAVRGMVGNFAHWEHARFVLGERLRVPEPVARDAYSAALKVVHGPDDPRIPAVFTAGKDLIRLAHRWISLDGSFTLPKDAGGIIKAFPAVLNNTEGETSIDPDRLTRFLTPGMDVEPYGYPPLSLCVGAKIYGHHLPYEDGRIVYSVPHAAYRQFPPRYVKFHDRMPLGTAWEVVERFFPGITRNYLLLLIAAKGCSEGKTSQATFMMVDGPSGSGKSTIAKLAAGICGDHADEVQYAKEAERLRQGIMSAMDKGSFVVINEIFKESARSRVKAASAVDPILNLTEDSTGHKLYVGHVALGKLPVLVLTDTKIPPSVMADVQLARRLVYVHLSHKHDWDQSMLAMGSADPKRFRLDEERAAAADALLSHVIDTYFDRPRAFAEIAHELGFPTLLEHNATENGDPHNALRQLFELVSDAPDLSANSDRTRFPGRGWKVVRRDDVGGELAELWRELADGEDGEAWTESRRCSEVDWAKVLRLKSSGGVLPAVRFQVGRYKLSAVYLRFAVGPARTPERVNREITLDSGAATA